MIPSIAQANQLNGSGNRLASQARKPKAPKTMTTIRTALKSTPVSEEIDAAIFMIADLSISSILALGRSRKSIRFIFA